MSALNIFKKKPKAVPKEKVKVANDKKKQPAVKLEKRPGYAEQVLQFPHITEKATDLTERNQYIFKIYPHANKIEVRKAVENLYGVKVISVRIINVPRRRRRLGRIMGWRGGYKKAIVGVKEGQKIEIMPR